MSRSISPSDSESTNFFCLGPSRPYLFTWSSHLSNLTISQLLIDKHVHPTLSFHPFPFHTQPQTPYGITRCCCSLFTLPPPWSIDQRPSFQSCSMYRVLCIGYRVSLYLVNPPVLLAMQDEQQNACPFHRVTCISSSFKNPTSANWSINHTRPSQIPNDWVRKINLKSISLGVLASSRNTD